MSDIFSKEKRSEVMSLIRSKNTKPEIALRKLLSSSLYPKGYRYRIHTKGIPGKPDIAFVSKKIAIFVDGDFWHGYDFEKTKLRLSQEYWLPKIERNIQRDKEVNQKLRKLGWKVLRFWEHDIQKTPDKVAKKVIKLLENENNMVKR
jgi:DNA mismatch endonuclease (patch repair protein)